MSFKKKLFTVVSQLPVIRSVFSDYFEFKKNSFFPAGHYYSPIVSIEKVENNTEIWKERELKNLPAISLFPELQLNLVTQLAKYYPEMPFKKEIQDKLRYHFDNAFYSYTDATILYSMIRHCKPKRIIEVGSGFSSAVMLDTNELFFDNQIQLTFIEPYPERLHSILNEHDKATSTIIQQDVQSIDLALFEKLEANDMLFIDSTHIVKTNSDVNHILFKILPVLKSGVLIHFHDIFYPFEYPKDWILKGLNWNEDYFLRAFLMYNNSFEIALFADYLHKHFPEVFTSMPLCYENTGGNLWLVKK